MSAARDLVSVVVADHAFGIPVEHVRDVLLPRRLTRIPLAPPEVAGMLNLRGRIVVALDLRRRLGFAPAPTEMRQMCVVVEHEGELYSLLVDAVGEVLCPEASSFEANPSTLDPVWRDVSAGIYRLQGTLLVLLDVARTLALRPASAAAA
jgi:purine-binding chemotaxis protein CheW